MLFFKKEHQVQDQLMRLHKIEVCDIFYHLLLIANFECDNLIDRSFLSRRSV